MFCPLAANRNCVAASRTWPTLPGADWNLLDHTVCTESTMTSAGLAAPPPRGCARGRSRPADTAAPRPAPRRSPRLFTWCSDSSPEAYSTGPTARAKCAGRLQEQRGLADAGFAAQQHQRPGHDAAAQHAIELVDAGGQAHGLGASRRRRTASRRSPRPAARSALARRPAGSAARSSTSVFQPPHSAQRPIHLGACAPHSWQTKTTFGAFIRTPAPPACPAGRRPPTESCRSPRPSRARRSAASPRRPAGR